MCTQQMMRMRQNTSNSKSWQEMFPNPQLSEQISATFLKKLVAIAISNITYLRNIFPEGAFADRYLEGLNLKVLRDDGCFPAVSQLIRWIKGSFEALDHKFLRQLIIGIYNDPSNPNNVLETYSFHFSYTNKRLSGCTYYQDDGRNKKEVVTEKMVSSEETFRQTISLFRHCIMCTHSLKPLPQGSMINMRLLYYDEVTPDDYEPPGFKPSPVASYTFVNDPILLNLGETNTPWHGMKLLLATDASDFEIATDNTASAANADATTSGDSQHGTTTGNSSQPGKSSTLKTPVQGQTASTSNDEPKSVNAVVPSISPAQPASAVSTTGSSWAEGAEQDGQRIRCPCGTMAEVGLMVMCTTCKYWQHANCFKILTEDELPQNHICELCHSPDSQCTDDSLPKLMPNQRKEICQYRRALGLCSESYRMSESDLIENLGVDMILAKKIMSKLDKDGVFKLTNKKSKGKYRLINKLHLKKTALAAHFSKNPEQCKVVKPSETQEDSEGLCSQITQETPQTIEAMTEKLSLSNQTEEKSMDATTSENKGKKRNLLAMMKHTTDVSDSEKESNAEGKKRRKASVSDHILF